jgi:hypothetical protein
MVFVAVAFLSVYANNANVETEKQGTNWLHPQKSPESQKARRA